ncbi:oxidoreductase [Biscogniauxia mediterranea]|nr:oxidoreductase [Biscogniauxia mediterranea]
MESNYAAFLLGHKMRPLRVTVADDRYPDENEIVIRVCAIAINQIDWKMQDTPWKMFKYPIIMGTDVAGEVVDVGSEVTRFKIGDRVLGHAVSFDTEDERHAAMQNYSVLMSNMASPIPESLSFEQAVVLPLGVSTAAAALFQKDCLALPKPSLNPAKTFKTVLIWGGASSVGSNAIQLAIAAGCEVVATASRKSFDYVKQLGAAEVVDYRSPNKKEELLKLFRTRELAGAFDAIGVEDTFNSTAEIVAQASGRRFIASTGDLEDVKAPEGVEFQGVFAVNIRKNEVGAMIYEEFLPEALKTGKYIIAPEPLIVGKGLSSVQAGIDASKSPSGKKVVVSV